MIKTDISEGRRVFCIYDLNYHISTSVKLFCRKIMNMSAV